MLVSCLRDTEMPGESLLGRCWAAYTTSTSGWLRDPSQIRTELVEGDLSFWHPTGFMTKFVVHS